MTGALASWLSALRTFVAARVTAAGESPRAAAPEPPADDRLDVALELSAPQRGFVWTCIAAAIDPLLHPHVLTAGGSDGRRGLSVATSAALVGCDAETAVDLAAWLARRPAIVRLGLVTAAADGLAIAATPFAPAARLCTHVAGL